MPYCTGCGIALSEQAKFCRRCGKAVKSIAADDAAEPSSTIQLQADMQSAATTEAPTITAAPALSSPSQAPTTSDYSAQCLPSRPGQVSPGTADGQQPVPSSPQGADEQPPPVGAPWEVPPLTSAGPIVIRGRPSHGRFVRGRLLVALVVLLITCGTVAAFWLSGSRPHNKGFVRPVPTSAPSSKVAASATSAPEPSGASLSPTSDRVTVAATEVSLLLDSSAAVRASVWSATAGLAACYTNQEEQDPAFATAVTTIQQLLSSPHTAPFAALPSGARLQALLIQAWRLSLKADREFLAWDQIEASNASCGIEDQTYRDAVATLAQASTAKKLFAALWNTTVAAPLQLPVRGEEDL